MTSICIVAPSPAFYASLSRPTLSRVAGAELQQLHLGEALRERGYEVSYITVNDKQSDIEIINGFPVFGTYKSTAGLPGFRFFYPRLPRIWNALQKADADVYYCRTASFVPGILALFAQRHQKTFIFAGASDSDFLPNQLLISSWRDRALYRYGLARATTIVVQSRTQEALLKKHYRRAATVIPNFLLQNASLIPPDRRKHILWVSHIRALKQPIQFVRLAQAFPKEQFIMIGGPMSAERKLFQDVQEEANAVPNLGFLGSQPFPQTEDYFDKCKVLVNTSTVEGFPNTFLQAWRRGIPVITYVDPDETITRNKLGQKVTSEAELHSALRKFLDSQMPDPHLIVEYFATYHSRAVIDRYVQLIQMM